MPGRITVVAPAILPAPPVKARDRGIGRIDGPFRGLLECSGVISRASPRPPAGLADRQCGATDHPNAPTRIVNCAPGALSFAAFTRSRFNFTSPPTTTACSGCASRKNRTAQRCLSRHTPNTQAHKGRIANPVGQPLRTRIRRKITMSLRCINLPPRRKAYGFSLLDKPGSAVSMKTLTPDCSVQARDPPPSQETPTTLRDWAGSRRRCPHPRGLLSATPRPRRGCSLRSDLRS